MDKLTVIKTETEEMLKKMIEKYELEVTEENGIFNIVIKTEEEAPTIIGRHGETIRAIQKIIEVIAYKNIGEPVNILVNVNDYREKQKERLENLAAQAAERARAEQRQTYLRGFSSYERRIMHEYITANYADLTTYSIGEGKDRRLIIDLKKDGQEEQAAV